MSVHIYSAAVAHILLVVLIVARQNAASADPQNFSMLYNSTATYISTVNESTYLIFKPNLTDAYALLYAANAVASTNPALASRRLLEARQAADEANAANERYSRAALAITSLLAAITSVAIYLQTRPYRAKRRNTTRGRRRR